MILIQEFFKSYQIFTLGKRVAENAVVIRAIFSGTAVRSDANLKRD